MHRTNYEENIKNWWNLASSYYQEEISSDNMEDVNYGPFGSSEKKLHLLEKIKGKKILDIGCGGGQASIALAKQGGICTGIDISEKQITAAVKNSKKEGVSVEFLISPFSSISKFGKNVFDTAISIMSLQYCNDLSRLFNDVNRLLRRDGLFVFSIEHPFYLIVNPATLKINDSYFSEGIKREKETGTDGKSSYYLYYNRKISTIVNLVVSAGFVVEKILEPMEKPDIIWGNGYRRALINKIGPTLIFKCRKI
jgi:ubiquinone/menaquinone biosynthesis C-methylase UbiE